MRSRKEVVAIFTKVAAMYGYLRDPLKAMSASFKPVASAAKVIKQSKPAKLPKFNVPAIPKPPKVV